SVTISFFVLTDMAFTMAADISSVTVSLGVVIAPGSISVVPSMGRMRAPVNHMYPALLSAPREWFGKMRSLALLVVVSETPEDRYVVTKLDWSEVVTPANG